MNMKCAARLFFLLVLGFALVVPGAEAQTQTGTVEGKVTDQQDAVLPGVTLTLTGPRGVQSTVSDGEGNFRFVGVAPATYVLKAELSGFVPQEQVDGLGALHLITGAQVSIVRLVPEGVSPKSRTHRASFDDLAPGLRWFARP